MINVQFRLFSDLEAPLLAYTPMKPSRVKPSLDAVLATIRRGLAASAAITGTALENVTDIHVAIKLRPGRTVGGAEAQGQAA